MPRNTRPLPTRAPSGTTTAARRKTLTALALVIGLSHSVAEAKAPTSWQVPIGGTIQKLVPAIKEGHEDEPEASHCKDFALPARKVVLYFKLARPVSRHEVLTTDDYPWPPCVLRGSYMKKGKRLFSFELSATLLGEVKFTDGSTVLLWCDKSCQRRVFAGEPCCSGR